MDKKKQDEQQSSGKIAGRDKKGRFTEGNIPTGHRKKGTKNCLTLLREALDKEGEKQGITFWEKVAYWSFTDKKMAAVVLRKFVPDEAHVEHSGDPESPIIVKFKDD